jgi:hypothetical protein
MDILTLLGEDAGL